MAGREDTPRILDVLAALAGGGSRSAAGARSVPLDWFRWLPVRSVGLFHGQVWTGRPATLHMGPETGAVPHQVHLGWLWLAGRATVNGRWAPIFTPLVECEARLTHRNTRLEPVTAAQVGSVVTDQGARMDLGQRLAFGGGAFESWGETDDNVAVPAELLRLLPSVQSFARDAARAAGFPTAKLLPAGAAPTDLMDRDRVAVFAGVGMWSEKEAPELGRAGSLRAWGRHAGRSRRPTAFEQLYLDDLGETEVSAATSVVGPAPTPFVLSAQQRRAVEAARRDPVTVVSGSPGTGKSHLLVALACDLLASGHRVLIAARSDDSADALLDLLRRAPGPEPVVFGSDERSRALAGRLAAGRIAPCPGDEVDDARRQLDDAVWAETSLREAISEQLVAESGAESPSGSEPGDPRLPRLDEADFPLTEAEEALAACGSGGGLLAHHRHHAAERHLRQLAGAPEDVPLADLGAAIAALRVRRRAAELSADGGPELGDLWADLEVAAARTRDRAGSWLHNHCRSSERLDRPAMAAVAALATALRRGRAARREALRRLPPAVTRALPLWIGSLPDIDDLLPAGPELFDVVLLDEASSIDQALAAPALLRAPRAVLAGDPQQLRHVSFVSDGRTEAALSAAGLVEDPVAGKLDVRRNSIWDVGASVAAVIELDEHHRSVPHLVDWVADRLYGGRVRVATRSPRTTGVRAIDVHRVPGSRNDDHVVPAEVTQVARLVRRLRNGGATSVGVMSPFRAQADAIRDVLERDFTKADRENMHLRTGTVHSFQGNERDAVVISLGVGEGDERSWAFVEDPHLFAVLATRARQRIDVVLAGSPPEGGLVAGWLANAETPPAPPRARDGAVSAWARHMAEDLRDAGLAPITAYPVGSETVDVVLGDTDRAVAIDCGVHPDGPAAHIGRRLALRATGWEVRELWPTRGTTAAAEPVLDLIGELGPLAPGTPAT